MNLSCVPLTAVIVLVSLKAFFFVDGNNKHRKCHRRAHCLTQKRTVLTNVSQTESNINQSLWRNGSKKFGKQEDGSKRDTAFTDVLKNLLLMVDKAKPKSDSNNSPSQRSTARLPKPISKAAGEHHSKTTTTPSHPSVTAAATTPSSPTLSSPGTTDSTAEVTSASAGTVTGSPSPTENSPTATTSVANMSCTSISDEANQPPCPTKIPPLSKPGVHSSKNISVAPGVVITSEGQIILNPRFPLFPTVAPKPVNAPSLGPVPFPAIQIPGNTGSLVIEGEWHGSHHALEAEQGECVNKFKHCADWASKGECAKNAAFMAINCRRSCTQCGTCENEQNQCVEWAKNGECRKNFQFMEQKCWRSCSKCAPCVDNHPVKCLQWAKKNQCALNRKFMEQKCWKSCSGCEKCENKNERCLEWAENGQCTKTPLFMMHFCWKSCSSCAPCVDKHPKKCPMWAEKDQCKKNRQFMEENCWRSCSKCCKDKNKHCVSWAKRGECTKNPDFMNEHCPMTCNVC